MLLDILSGGVSGGPSPVSSSAYGEQSGSASTGDFNMGGTSPDEQIDVIKVLIFAAGVLVGYLLGGK